MDATLVEEKLKKYVWREGKWKLVCRWQEEQAGGGGRVGGVGSILEYIILQLVFNLNSISWG